VQVVDNRLPFDAVNGPLTRDLLTHYYRRFRTWRNALFLSNPERRPEE